MAILMMDGMCLQTLRWKHWIKLKLLTPRYTTCRMPLLVQRFVAGMLY